MHSQRVCRRRLHACAVELLIEVGQIAQASSHFLPSCEELTGTKGQGAHMWTLMLAMGEIHLAASGKAGAKVSVNTLPHTLWARAFQLSACLLCCRHANVEQGSH